MGQHSVVKRSPHIRGSSGPMTDQSSTSDSPSLWDRLVVPYPMFPLADHTSPDGDRLRLERRTSQFAEALSKQERAGSAPAAPAELVAEYKARLAQWDRLSASLVDDDDFCRARRTLTRSGSAGAGAAILWFPIYFIYYALRRGFRLGTMARLDRALRNRTCPDCEYDLTGTND